MKHKLAQLCKTLNSQLIYFVPAVNPLIVRKNVDIQFIIELHQFLMCKQILIDTFSHLAFALCKYVTDICAATCSTTH